MDCVQSKARMNVEDDRLSMLPDDLIHKILSFISTKRVVQTSALSSRWRFLWTSMPYLDMSTDGYYCLPDFSNFVNHVFSGRNDEIEVHSVKLAFHHELSEALLKQILDYAFSHDVQHLTVTCLQITNTDFPLDLFRSRSLKYLRLIGCRHAFLGSYPIILASTWELPALTTLHLDYVTFYEDIIFSKCANLKNLTLNCYALRKLDTFTLSHPRLSNLTLENGYFAPRAVNVVAPQLENLIIRNCSSKHLVTAPNLSSLLANIGDYGLLQFSTELPSLEKANLCISYTSVWSCYTVADLLQKLCNVKFFTLNLEFVKPLILYMERVSLQPSPFSNLKTLKIYPVDVPSDDEPHKKVIMTSKVLNYFLDGSPSATFTMISYEETKESRQKAKEIANAAAAQNLMENLQVLLEQEKTKIENNITRIIAIESDEQDGTDEEENETDDQGKTPVKSMQLQLKKKMGHMKRCWEDVGVRIDKGKRDTRYIIYRLRDIEVALLKDLPASKRDELQACFSSLCVEVDTVVRKILHHTMTSHIDLSDCINELATVSLLS